MDDIDLDLVTETDLAQVFAVNKVLQVDQSESVDLAQTFAISKHRTLVVVVEPNVAQTLVSQHQVLLEQSSESDVAQDVTVRRGFALVEATSTSTARTLTRVKRMAITSATATNTASNLQPQGAFYLPTGPSEHDTVGVLHRVKKRTIARVLEHDSISVAELVPIHQLSGATSTHLARAFTPQRRRLITTATEADLSRAVGAVAIAASDLHLEAGDVRSRWRTVPTRSRWATPDSTSGWDVRHVTTRSPRAPRQY